MVYFKIEGVDDGDEKKDKQIPCPWRHLLDVFG